MTHRRCLDDFNSPVVSPAAEKIAKRLVAYHQAETAKQLSGRCATSEEAKRIVMSDAEHARGRVAEAEKVVSDTQRGLLSILITPPNPTRGLSSPSSSPNTARHLSPSSSPGGHISSSMDAKTKLLAQDLSHELAEIARDLSSSQAGKARQLETNQAGIARSLECVQASIAKQLSDNRCSLPLLSECAATIAGALNAKQAKVAIELGAEQAKVAQELFAAQAKATKRLVRDNAAIAKELMADQAAIALELIAKQAAAAAKLEKEQATIASDLVQMQAGVAQELVAEQAGTAQKLLVAEEAGPNASTPPIIQPPKFFAAKPTSGRSRFSSFGDRFRGRVVEAVTTTNAAPGVPGPEDEEGSTSESGTKDGASASPILAAPARPPPPPLLTHVPAGSGSPVVKQSTTTNLYTSPHCALLFLSGTLDTHSS